MSRDTRQLERGTTDSIDVLPDLSQLVARPPRWWVYARCRGAGVAAFFSSDRQTAKAAKETCARCWVKDECLEFALADTDLVGIFGGTTDAERRRLRRTASASNSPVSRPERSVLPAVLQVNRERNR